MKIESDLVNRRGIFGRGSFVRAVAARTGAALAAVFGASVVVWALLAFAPGDAAQRVLQARGVENPSAIEIATAREELGLSRPLAAQYFVWLGRAARGDLSVSYRTGKPVAAEIARRLPASALLVGVSLVLAIALSVAAALAAAAFHQKTPDKIIQFLTQAGAACPAFLLGLLLLYFLVVGFGVGKIISTDPLADVWLPAVCLAVGRAADWTQILRANLLAALALPLTLTAAARGATRRRILLRYALPNALTPFLTVVGVGVGGLLGGAAIVETVFSYEGIGSYAVQSIAARDLPAVQGFVILSTVVFVAANLAADIAAVLVDPRLKQRMEG